MRSPEVTNVSSELLDFDLELILNYAASEAETSLKIRKPKPEIEKTEWIPVMDRCVRAYHPSPVPLSAELLDTYVHKGISNPERGVYHFSSEAFDIRAGTVDPSLLMLQSRQKGSVKKGIIVSLNLENQIERTEIFNELKFITNRLKKCRPHFQVSRLLLEINLHAITNHVEVLLSYTVRLEPSFHRYFSSDVSMSLMAVLKPHITPYPTDTDPFYKNYEAMPNDAHLFYQVITDKTSLMPRVESPMAHPHLLTELLPFQRKTVKWLLEKESMRYVDETQSAEYVPLISPSLVKGIQDFPNVDHEWLDKEIYQVLNHLCYGWNRVLYRDDICWANDLIGNILTREDVVKFLKESFEDLNKEPMPARGLLSEEMGLGKTIEVIDLILLNQRPAEEVGQEIKLRLQEEGDLRTVIKAKTTLITAPQTIIHQWYNEISRFCPSLSVTIYRGLGKYPELSNIPRYIGEYLRRFDIVLLNYANMSSEADYANYTSKHMTTRGGKKRTASEAADEANADNITVESFKADFTINDGERAPADVILSQKRYERAVMDELAAKIRRQDLSKIPHTEYYESPLMSSQWWRVVMDEVQMVSSVLSNAFSTASLIPRFHSWGVSGTPARTVAVLQFLRLPPFNYEISKYCWKKVAQYPESNVDFVKIWSYLALRHTKAMVDKEISLPPQRRILLTLPLTKVEQDKYSQMFESCLASIGIYLDANQVPNRTELSQSDCVHLRSWLVKLRQLCGNLQIGNLPILKGKRSKFLLQGLPEMKTLESVLDDMMSSVLAEINEGERNVISRLLDIAQLLEYLLLPEKVIEILENALYEVSKLLFQLENRFQADIVKLNNVRAFLKEHKVLSAKQLSIDVEDEEDDEEAESDSERMPVKKEEEVDNELSAAEVSEKVGKFNRLKESTTSDRMRLRSLKLLQHKCYFLLASAHFQVYDEEYQKKIMAHRIEFKTLSSIQSDVIGVKLLKSDEINYGATIAEGAKAVSFERPNFLKGFEVSDELSLEEQKIERHKYLESQYYEKAEECRKDLLKHTIRDAHETVRKRILNRTTMDPDTFINDGQSSFPKTTKKLLRGLPEIYIDELLKIVGNSKVKQLMTSFSIVVDELNKQAAVISDFVNQLVQVLSNPLLSDEKSPDGEEYEKSLEDQDRASCLMVVISQLLMDRSNAIYERKTRVTDIKKKQEKDLKEEARRVSDRAFLKALQKSRNECRPKSDLSFEELLQDARLVELELSRTVQGETFSEIVEVLRSIFENEKNCQELLQKEISNSYNAAFNARVEYFKQLQQISDSVQGKTYVTEQDNLEETKVNSEVASCLMLFTAAQRKLTRAVSRFRYLSTLMPEEDKKVKDEEVDDSNECVICQCSIVVGSLTPCGHKFCKACLDEWLHARSMCPICKNYITRDTVHHFTHYESDLKAQAVENGTHDANTQKKAAEADAVHQIYKQLDDATLKKISSIQLKNSYGSKVDLIVKQVLYLREQDPEVQIVVFSQWQDLLVILAFAFDVNGISYVSAKGSHVAQYKNRKEDPAEEFKRKDNLKTCFLLNAQVQASGLTLINATHIFLCEPLVNTPVELQAISRIHRIGQTKVTTVWMFGIENSVEENIVALGTRNRLAYLKANAEESQKNSPKRRRIGLAESTAKVDGNLTIADDELKTAESYALSLGLTNDRTGRVFLGISESVSDKDIYQVYFGDVDSKNKENGKTQEAKIESLDN